MNECFLQLLAGKTTISCFKISAPWSPYWKHLKEAWENRDHPNLLFLFYEDLQLVSITY